jgi:hypothetical protein
MFTAGLVAMSALQWLLESSLSLWSSEHPLQAVKIHLLGIFIFQSTAGSACTCP